MSFTIKRVYEKPAATDGLRVLVDRLWPRGLRRSDAHLSWWMKDVAPSPDLRKWFDHDPLKFAQFKRRYTLEMRSNAAVVELRRLGKSKRVTLLYGARDPKVNHAIILQKFLARARL